MAETTAPVTDGWQTVGDKTTSKLLEEGILSDEWTMYFERKDQEKNGLSEADYMNSLLNVGTFNSFKGFLTRWETVTKSEVPGNIHIFKKGILPIWEDEQNINGGKWVASLLKEQDDEQPALKSWFALVVSVLSEQIGYADQICGVVLALKQWGTSLHIWNRDADDVEQQEQVKQKLAKLLKTKKVKYVKHRTSLQKNSEVMFPHNDGEKKHKDKPDLRGPSPANRRGPSPANHRGPSPANHRGPSPATRRGPSPANRRGPSPSARHVSPMDWGRRGPSPSTHPDRRISPDRRVSPNPRSDKLEKDWNATKEAAAKEAELAEALRNEPAPPPAKNPWNIPAKTLPTISEAPTPEPAKAEPAPPPAKNPWTKQAPVPAVEILPVEHVKVEPVPAKVLEAEQAKAESAPAPAPAKNPWNLPPKPVTAMGVDFEVEVPKPQPPKQEEKQGKKAKQPKQPEEPKEKKEKQEKKEKKEPKEAKQLKENKPKEEVASIWDLPEETKKAKKEKVVTRPRSDSETFGVDNGSSYTQSSKITRRGEAPQAVWDGKRLIEKASAPAPAAPAPVAEKVKEQPKAKAPKPAPAPAPVPQESDDEEEAKPELSADEWQVVKEVKKVRGRSNTLTEETPVLPVEVTQKQVAPTRSTSVQPEKTRSQSPAVVPEPNSDVATKSKEPKAPKEKKQPQATQPAVQSQPSQPKKRESKAVTTKPPTTTATTKVVLPTVPTQQQTTSSIPIQQIAIAGGLVLVSIVSYYMFM